MVVHKKILVKGNVINSPGYIVKVSEETELSLKSPISNPNEIDPTPTTSASSEKSDSSSDENSQPLSVSKNIEGEKQ